MQVVCSLSHAILLTAGTCALHLSWAFMWAESLGSIGMMVLYYDTIQSQLQMLVYTCACYRTNASS